MQCSITPQIFDGDREVTVGSLAENACQLTSCNNNREQETEITERA